LFPRVSIRFALAVSTISKYRQSDESLRITEPERLSRAQPICSMHVNALSLNMIH
jgi:hypothetical protein